MSIEVRAILLVVLVTVVVIVAVVAVRSFIGKPTKGTLRVPQGKTFVPIVVCDGSPLRPFKYGQVFDVRVLRGEQTGVPLTSATGEEITQKGALSYHGVTIGFSDASSRYTKALSVLADKHDKVIAQAVIVSLDTDNNPVMQLELPKDAWFARAIKPYGES